MEPPRNILLKDFQPQSELLLEEHHIKRAKFSAVNSHVHLCNHNTPEKMKALVEKMDEWNVRTLIDLPFDGQMPVERLIEQREKLFPGRFLTLATLPWGEAFAEGGDIGGKLAKMLERHIRNGAAGLKIYKSLGLEFRDSDRKLVRPDDPRIGEVFDKCAELKVPCLEHIADPIAFFKPLTLQNERLEEILENPDWHFYGKDYPTFDFLMECQQRLLEQHPQTKFIIPHIAGCPEKLAFVGKMLDRFPNLYVDTSARVSELGRQPYSSRKFLIRYADRILYGTDDVGRMRTDPVYFRFLETFDEYFPYSMNTIPDQGRWNIYGIGLPDDVLERVYSRNAEKLYPQLRVK